MISILALLQAHLGKRNDLQFSEEVCGSLWTSGHIAAHKVIYLHFSGG